EGAAERSEAGEAPSAPAAPSTSEAQWRGQPSAARRGRPRAHPPPLPQAKRSGGGSRAQRGGGGPERTGRPFHKRSAVEGAAERSEAGEAPRIQTTMEMARARRG